MRVLVTSADIAIGERDNVALCPVALAMQGVSGNPLWRVGDRHCWLEDRDDLWVIPDLVQIVIQRFDAGEVVDPIEFDIDPESPDLKA